MASAFARDDHLNINSYAPEDMELSSQNSHARDSDVEIDDKDSFTIDYDDDEMQDDNVNNGNGQNLTDEVMDDQDYSAYQRLEDSAMTEEAENTSAAEDETMVQPNERVWESNGTQDHYTSAQNAAQDFDAQKDSTQSQQIPAASSNSDSKFDASSDQLALEQGNKKHPSNRTEEEDLIIYSDEELDNDASEPAPPSASRAGVEAAVVLKSSTTSVADPPPPSAPNDEPETVVESESSNTSTSRADMDEIPSTKASSGIASQLPPPASTEDDQSDRADSPQASIRSPSNRTLDQAGIDVDLPRATTTGNSMSGHAEIKPQEHVEDTLAEGLEAEAEANGDGGDGGDDEVEDYDVDETYNAYAIRLLFDDYDEPISLFAQSDEADEHSFLLTDANLSSATFQFLFAACRIRLGVQSIDCYLAFDIPALGLTIQEGTPHASTLSLSYLQDLYLDLFYANNDGTNDDLPFFDVRLIIRQDVDARLQTLHQGLATGRSLSDLALLPAAQSESYNEANDQQLQAAAEHEIDEYDSTAAEEDIIDYLEEDGHETSSTDAEEKLGKEDSGSGVVEGTIASSVDASADHAEADTADPTLGPSEYSNQGLKGSDLVKDPSFPAKGNDNSQHEPVIENTDDYDATAPRDRDLTTEDNRTQHFDASEGAHDGDKNTITTAEDDYQDEDLYQDTPVENEVSQGSVLHRKRSWIEANDQEAEVGDVKRARPT